MKPYYRLAQLDDGPAIAMLHAKSWQLHYRNSLEDHYLDGPVIADRFAVWEQRLSEPPENQWVMTAWYESKLIGFICLYLDDHPRYGALLDNLHVEIDAQGKGIGKALLNKGWAQVKRTQKAGNMYLWVLDKNVSAQRFYERMKGVQKDAKIFDNPGGGTSVAIRYVFEP